MAESTQANKMEDRQQVIEVETKKIKLDSNGTLNILNTFEFVKVLNENNLSKLMIIQAVKKDETRENKNAVIIFEKPHFGLEEVKSFLQIDNPYDIDLQNDIYNKFCLYPLRPYNNVQVQLIYPATEQHIQKYSMQEFFFVKESFEDYQNLTLKFINETQLNLKWVYNILEHKTESERIIFEDPDPQNGFILLPDMKWDCKVVDNLYVLAIVHQKDLLSLRNLTGEHIGLLENVRDKSLRALEEKFDVKKEKLRAYFHYQPSFYHLHVHFTHIKNQMPGMPERNIQLNQVLENLRIDSSYYQKVTMEMAVKKNDKLYDLFKHKFD
ncbi:unnamed protein product [Brachionus calyciflorus]|uniref:m7GpppX diphosphatase n=1 Tax=Brachionus calyciflorus TaxID=104777 RepID=A0A813M1Q5_9BILA|nr:unnamed protein product [Brachionus calyciflorus]